MGQFNGDIVHDSVLVNEILELLKPAHPDSLFIDCTLGEGGHSEVFLKSFPGIQLMATERDEEILKVARARLEPWKDRVHFFNIWFHDFFRQYSTYCDQRPDRILFDLGISKYHYKKSGYGFSFEDDQPLDMRLDRSSGDSAGDIVNTYEEWELAEIFKEYGEERLARRIAGKIIEARSTGQIETAKRLASIIEQAYPAKMRRELKIHPATRCFQALRIVVNRELDNLKEVLESSFEVLKPGGRIAVIAYHSLEDRIVKRFFQEKNKVCTCPPEWPICRCEGKRKLTLLTRKPVVPTEEESTANRAARSARLRVIEKCE